MGKHIDLSVITDSLQDKLKRIALIGEYVKQKDPNIEPEIYRRTVSMLNGIYLVKVGNNLIGRTWYDLEAWLQAWSKNILTDAEFRRFEFYQYE